uniref:Fc fragment of IgM receptor n=1 Tax=Nannospalax galili TaxID=1026970 RepID=A0A8C6RRJ8_NANGA
MELWLWLLCFLPVSGTLKILPEVHLDGALGGSIIIECPLPEIYTRMYLCRQMTNPSICVTVVSNSFVKDEYRSRVTLKPCFDKNIFLVEVTKLTKSDNGVYACGVGTHTDRGRTQKVTVNVHNEYKPFWEDEPTSGLPGWFDRFLNQQMPNWFHEVTQATPSEFISKATTPVPKTEVPPIHQLSNTAPITHHPQVSRTSLVVAVESPDFLPPTTVSKTSAQEGVRPLGASYSHHTRLDEQRTRNHDPQTGREDQEFHILIPSVLGLLLATLLGLVIKRAIQRRKAFSRSIRRLAARMRTQGGSGRSPAQRPRPSRRPRSQNNVYSACPWRARNADAAGQEARPLPSAGASAPSAPPLVPEVSWIYAPSLKTSCDYVSLYHQPAAHVEDTDSDDYINIPSLTHLPSCLSGPRPSCQ